MACPPFQLYKSVLEIGKPDPWVSPEKNSVNI